MSAATAPNGTANRGVQRLQAAFEKARAENRAAFVPTMEAELAKRSRADLVARLAAARDSIPSTAIAAMRTSRQRPIVSATAGRT